jgi:hypothetical protein
MIFPKKPEILYAPMLATFGGGSANGFRASGGITYDPTPAYTSQGAANYFSNYGDPWVTTSNNIGLTSSQSSANDAHNYYTQDAYGGNWYIGANWTYQGSTAWSNVGVNRFGDRNKTTLDPSNKGHNLLAHTALYGDDIYCRWVRVGSASGVNSATSGTAAGIFDSTVMNEKGSIFYDGDSFSNTAGAGYQSWYSDNKSGQQFPDVIDAIYNNYTTSNNSTMSNLQSMSGQGDENGGAVFWTPYGGASEVLIDFANDHSNTRCSFTVWNNATGSIVHTYNFGKFGGGVDRGSGAINDSSSYTYVATHNPDYVYIIVDHGGTVCGTHYFLYR